MKKHLLTSSCSGEGITKLKRNAFTLIELLAIIVILAIIAVITVPIILNIIENSKKGAVTDSAYGYKDSINKYYVTKLLDDQNYRIDGTYTINENGQMVKGNEIITIPINGQKPVGGELTYELQKILSGCLTIDGYKVLWNDNKIDRVEKGTCYEQTTITFDSNGGSAVAPQTKNIDKKIGTLPQPTRTNYALQGWFTETTGGTQINEDTIVTGSTTYYAHWVQNAVSVTFDSRGGNAITSTTVEINHTYKQDHTQLPTPTRSGYDFLGWFETQEGGTAITGNETLTTDKTYYAHWQEQVQSHTVTFVDGDDNSIIYSTQNVIEGEYATEPQEPTKANYLFSAWYDESDQLIYDFENYQIYDDTTIYAYFISSSSIVCPGPNCTYAIYGDYSAVLNSPASSNRPTKLSDLGSFSYESQEEEQEYCETTGWSYGCSSSDFADLKMGDVPAHNFLAHTLDSNGNITSSYACGIANNTPFCLIGYNGNYSNFEIFKYNIAILRTTFDFKNECECDYYYCTCTDDYYVSISVDNDESYVYHNDTCYAQIDGASYCYGS